MTLTHNCPTWPCPHCSTSPGTYYRCGDLLRIDNATLPPSQRAYDAAVRAIRADEQQSHTPGSEPASH